MQILLEKEHWFKTSQEAIDSVEEYKRLLYRKAEEQRLKGSMLGDQSIPIELFAFKPDFSTLPSVALLGGMGPLAGAEGFIKACQQFLDSREIVLLQACSVPDRSAVIVSSQAGANNSIDAKNSMNEHKLLIDLLCASIKKL
ncbi:MAG: hypothetical protein JNN15_09465, partial [Blastocatellia bacterium]|nr:hypothetical protein [Blastocatellia bacterium]